MARRCFISVDVLDDKLTQELGALQEELAQFGQNSRTDPDQFHFTMNFMGEVNESDLQNVRQRLREVEHDPFIVTLQSVGVFPDRDYIRVVWCGAEAEELTDLSKKIRSQLPERYRQDKEFHPHVTLVRMKNISREEKQQLQQKLDAYKDRVFGRMNVDRFRLKESTTSEHGAEHLIIEEYDLQ